MNLYDFYTGIIFNAYEYLGAHTVYGGTVFRVYAPQADGVCVLIFGQEIPMTPIADHKFYEVYVEGANAGEPYEYRVYHHGCQYTDHCDPYGFGMELRPAHRSIIRDLHNYNFGDDPWMRQRTDMKDRPLNIYEMHAGSWRKKGPEKEDWYSYEELAEPLVAYLKDNGYNFVEFMPLSEHPSDNSWGYQNTGFFSPTSRYGTMDQLKYLVDQLHQNNIGVIMDYVPVHFAVDAYGLSHFDGFSLYEYPDSDISVSEWGSPNFLHARGEVSSFLQSAANYWLKEYHVDGLRMDAISRIIYWMGDENRGVNDRALNFVKTMNAGLKMENPGCFLIAEDSTSYPDVTTPVEYGGLGYDYKWDMGWMHDTLEYFQSGPEYRCRDYHKLSFSMMYFPKERYLLPLSHDEVVHGKATVLQKMNGDYQMKFPQARAMYMYMYVHPGKKLNFMGNEIGHFREWDEDREQDWDLMKYPAHIDYNKYMKSLNHVYLEHPALYQWDYAEKGFQWLDCEQKESCIYTILRSCISEKLVTVFNFSAQPQHYELRLNESVGPVLDVKPVLYTDWQMYGGATPLLEETCYLKENKALLAKAAAEEAACKEKAATVEKASAAKTAGKASKTAKNTKSKATEKAETAKTAKPLKTADVKTASPVITASTGKTLVCELAPFSAMMIQCLG